MSSRAFKDYAEVKVEIAKLEEKRKLIELEIIDIWENESEGNRELNTPFGKFEMSGRRTWKYSSSIKSMQEAILEAKHKEESDGKAELVKHIQFVVFTPKKD